METYIATIIGITVVIVILLSLPILFFIAVSLWFNDFPKKAKFVDTDVKLNGKTAIVTGGSSPLGKVTAKELARRGARVILAVRNVKKIEPIRDEIIRETNNNQVKIMQVDLSDLRSVQRFCVEFNEREANLHILIHNAGVLPSDDKTKQGFNMVIGVNYIGPFLMTHLLLEKLKKSGPSRVISLTSHIPFIVDAIPCISQSMDLTEMDEEGNRFPNLNSKRDTSLSVKNFRPLVHPGQ